MLLTMYIFRNYILRQNHSFPKPGLGTLAAGTVFIQGLSATVDIEQYQYKGGKAWEVRGGLLWRLEMVCPDWAFTSASACFLQGPVGPAGGPGFPGAPGAKVRVLLVKSGTPPFPITLADCPPDDPPSLWSVPHPSPHYCYPWKQGKSQAFCRVTS